MSSLEFSGVVFLFGVDSVKEVMWLGIIVLLLLEKLLSWV